MTKSITHLSDYRILVDVYFDSGKDADTSKDNLRYSPCWTSYDDPTLKTQIKSLIDRMESDLKHPFSDLVVSGKGFTLLSTDTHDTRLHGEYGFYARYKTNSAALIGYDNWHEALKRSIKELKGML